MFRSLSWSYPTVLFLEFAILTEKRRPVDASSHGDPNEP